MIWWWQSWPETVSSRPMAVGGAAMREAPPRWIQVKASWSIHSKSEKVWGTAFSVKKIAEKVRKSGRHIWAIWGNFGPFWIILGLSRAMLDHFGPFGVIFGPLWGILGHFWPFLGHFVAYLDKFTESSIFFAAPLGSWGLLLECMWNTQLTGRGRPGPG